MGHPMLLFHPTFIIYMFRVLPLVYHFCFSWKGTTASRSIKRKIEARKRMDEGMDGRVGERGVYAGALLCTSVIRAFFLLLLHFGLSVLVFHTYAVKRRLGIGQDLAARACS